MLAKVASCLGTIVTVAAHHSDMKPKSSYLVNPLVKIYTKHFMDSTEGHKKMINGVGRAKYGIIMT